MLRQFENIIIMHKVWQLKLVQSLEMYNSSSYAVI